MTKQKQQDLGRSLIRDHKKKKTFAKEGFRHTCELPDGLDWARLNLRSVTEQNSVDDFLGKAELAESDYNKEFGNVKIAGPDEGGLLSQEEYDMMSAVQDLNKHFLSIPRRPAWNVFTTKEQLDSLEKTEFLNWRRKLSKLSEEQYMNLTPYEKNLEVWRQLWRVTERSDVLVQILDARNPLFFRCEDLENYVKEIGPKHNVLMLNKADFLAEEQRKFWAQYFQDIGVSIVFFSALQQKQKLSEIVENPKEENLAEDSESSSDDDSDNEQPSSYTNCETPKSNIENHSENCKILEKDVAKNVGSDIMENCVKTLTKDTKNINDESSQENIQNNCIKESESLASNLHVTDDVKLKTTISNTSKVYSKEELIDFFKNFKTSSSTSNFVTVGLVGYPNVGKSSLINVLTQTKRVQVSSTPGKTKHFQTFMVDSDLCLCDCPGLVFPNFVSTKAEMVVNGVLPIDHLTDHILPISLIVNLIPKHVLEATYSIIIPFQEDRRPNEITARDFLNAYGYMRGFMTQRGIPDTSRSSRYILKDFINGKILYCHSPPDVDDLDFQQYTIRPIKQQSLSIAAKNKLSKTAIASKEIDKTFFQNVSSQAHVKGNVMLTGSKSNVETNKPWKKHHNQNKKEKLRRVYRDHDC